MKVVEIFNSIDGEGARTGMLATFIRLYGCNLNCSYCDTCYATKGDEYKVMSVEDILEALKDIRAYRNITLTGGEPLIHPGVNKLIMRLIEEGYNVNVETNGTVIPQFREPDMPHYIPQLLYTMDYKLSGSGQKEKMSMSAINSLHNFDVLKFVVSSVKDMEEALEVMDQMTSRPCIYFSPVFGEIDPKEIVEFMQKHRLETARVQIQLHKIIWNPEERGV